MILFLFVSLAHASTDSFPTDYRASRGTFRAACAARLTGPDDFAKAFPVPGAPGDLTVDAAFFGRGGRSLLTLQSGTHGVEGYAGAAIQRRVLEHHLATLLDRGIDVMLIHAFDPSGFAHSRRVDAYNVNLNRAFPLDDAGYAVVNAGYRHLRGAFEPANPVANAWLEYLRTDRRLLWRFAQTRFDRRVISEAMNQGQHEFPEGVNYGGRAAPAQRAILDELLRDRLGRYAKVMFIDWHTGLGDKGTLHWMATETSTPDLARELKPAFDRLEPAGVRATTGTEAKGFYHVTGSVDRYVAGITPPGTSIVAATAEFGTMGSGLIAQVRTAHRLIVENQAWAHGCADERVAARVRRDFVELFTPPDPAWRAGVLRQADLIMTTLARDFGAR